MYKLCHTEESSRRQRELEAGLLFALGRQPYSKITLTELCRELGIPRKTFYRYFPTREDCLLALLDHTLSDCNHLALLGWNGSQTLNRQTLLRFFRFWLERRTLLDAVRDNGLEHLLLSRTTVIVDRMKESVPQSSFPRDQVEYFIAHGLMTTVLRWHRSGFPCTPEEMADVFGALLESSQVSMDRLLL